MKDEQDPALSQEEPTVADPPVTEDVAESPEESGEGTTPQKDEKEQDAETIEISVDGYESEPEPPPKESAAWARIRKSEREAKERAADLEKRLKVYEQPPQVADPGPKPTTADFDWDEAKYDEALFRWKEAKARSESAATEAAQRAQSNESRFRAKQDAYRQASGAISGFAGHHATVTSAIPDEIRQGVILSAADNPVVLVAALGKYPKLLEELAAVKDPIDFIKAVVKLEARVKTEKKSQVPPPEQKVRGSGSSSGAVDSQIDKAREKATKSGDVTESLARRRQQQRAEK